MAKKSAIFISLIICMVGVAIGQDAKPAEPAGAAGAAQTTTKACSPGGAGGQAAAGGGAATTEPAAGGAAPAAGGAAPAAAGSGVSKTVQMLCELVLYKDACTEILGSVAAANESATPQEIIKGAALKAVDYFSKQLNLTDDYEKKVDAQKEPGKKAAVDDCKDLVEYAVDKFPCIIDKIGNTDTYKNDAVEWDLRLWLSDAITYMEGCLDSLQEINATEFHDGMKGGSDSANQIAMSILDIITRFGKTFGGISDSLKPENIVGTLQGGLATLKQNINSRRLLGVEAMIGDDGLPRWLSAADRKLMNVDGARRLAAPPPPNAVVAQDGSGQFKTLTDAVNAYKPPAPGQKYVIYVKAGLYKENVVITKKMPFVYLYGDGATKSTISGSLSFAGKVPTSKTATVAVESPDFICHDMGFENTAGPEGHQAVALRANGERQVFFNCAFNAYQDTLYPQGGSQLFRDSVISGTVDFIFGNGATLIQRCTIIGRMPLPNQFNAVTAQGRTGPNMPTGLVIQDCTVQADPKLDKVKVKTYLGRPWKQYARTVFMESDLGDLIAPEGYEAWAGSNFDQTSYYGEYKNTGPGAATGARLKWPGIKVMTQQEAEQYTGNVFLKGGDAWLKPSGAVYYMGFKV